MRVIRTAWLLLTACFALSSCNEKAELSPSQIAETFTRECVDGRASLARIVAESGYNLNNSGCSLLGGYDCWAESRRVISWRPWGASDIRIEVSSDAANMSADRGDGVHCGMDFPAQPDAALEDHIRDYARDHGLVHESQRRDWTETPTYFTVWRGKQSDLPELRLIKPTDRRWTLRYVD